MVDPISLTAAGVSVVQGTAQLTKFLMDINDTSVISAHFRWDGTRLHGDERIKVVRQEAQNTNTVWWYYVEEIPEYTFIRAPVIESCGYELAGQLVGDDVPNALVWRWVAQEEQGVICNPGAPNLKVDFIVTGYRVEALIKHLTP